MSRSVLALLVSALALLCLGLQASVEPPHVVGYTHHAVATDHAEASAAALQILERGGTAADAAAAAMLALGVLNPGSSGFGGGGFALYYRASDRSLTFLDFREMAPAAATADMFTRPGVADDASRVGGLASGVPGEPAGIDALVTRFGRKPLREVVAPAVALARRGVTVSSYMRAQARYVADTLRTDATFRPWTVETQARVKQPALARTLTTFGRLGARAVYGGAIGDAIVRANRARGGLITKQDLLAYRVVERAPIELRALGHRFVSSPPPSAGGYVIASSLAFLASRPVAELRDPESFLHALAESWKGPYMDRTGYFGDPDHVQVPLDALSTEVRRAARARLFDPARARPASDYALPLAPSAPGARTPDGGGTSHLCVVDAEGNVASITTTVNLPFGARYSAAGFIMNDEMDDFARAVGVANAFELGGGAQNLPGPGRRPVSSMSPTIVFDATGPVLCIGAAGGSRIPTATEQVALRMLALGQSPREAIDAPRIHHQGEPATLRTESRVPMPAALRDGLARRGHALDVIENVAVVSMVRIIRNDGGVVLIAASDLRKGGQPRGR